MLMPSSSQGVNEMDRLGRRPAAILLAVLGLIALGDAALGRGGKPHVGDAPGKTCHGPLTGRTIDLPAGQWGFGAAQGQPGLPLRAGEYVLTIDDGPTPATTPKILDILRQHCIEATFMMVGKKAAANPDLVQTVLSAGHGAASHSWDHGNFSKMTPEVVRKDILGGADAVEQAGWHRDRPTTERRLFRIPGAAGVPNIPPPEMLAWLKSQNLVLAGVDISPSDWRNDPAPVSFKRMFTPTMPDRGVILMHDWPSNTLILMPMVLDELQKRGAKIVALHLRNGNEP
jgi:peptidoglycan-N-acetylglucosamine deacetylase